MNDNPPIFVKTKYEAEIAEDADNIKVLEVKAEDKDIGE